MKLIIMLALALSLSACEALGGVKDDTYQQRLDAWARGQEAAAVAQAAKYQVLRDIAAACPPTSEFCAAIAASTAAVAVAAGDAAKGGAAAMPPDAPPDWKVAAVGGLRDVLVVGLPAAAQVYMNKESQITARTQSRNQADVLVSASTATRDVAVAASSSSTAIAVAAVQSSGAASIAQSQQLGSVMGSLADVLPMLRPNVSVARDYVSADNGSTVTVDASNNGNNRTQGNDNNVDTKGQVGNRNCVASAAPATASSSASASATSTANPSALSNPTVVSGSPTNNCGD